MGKHRRLDFDPKDPEKLIISENILTRSERMEKTSTELEVGETEI